MIFFFSIVIEMNPTQFQFYSKQSTKKYPSLLNNISNIMEINKCEIMNKDSKTGSILST